MKFKVAALGAGLICLMLLSAYPSDKNRNRLLLTPGARLELAPVANQNDSLSMQFSVAVPDSLELERHRCVISANQKFSIATPPHQVWALRGDILMVLSSIDLTVRVKKEAASAFEMNFDFMNLEKNARNRGRAVVTIAPSKKVSWEILAGGSTKTAPAPTQNARPDSVSDTGSPNAVKSFAPQGKWLLWVLIGFLLIGLVVMIILASISRASSREFKKKAHKKTEAAPSHFRSQTEDITGRQNQRQPSSAGAFDSSARNREAQTRPSWSDETREDLAAQSQEEVSSSQTPLPATTTTPPQSLALVPRTPLLATLAKLRETLDEAQQALAAQNEAPQPDSTLTTTFAQKIAESAATLKPRFSLASQNEGIEQQGKPQIDLEEIAGAIDGVVAASAMKPLLAPQNMVAQKVEFMRRAEETLRKIAAACRNEGSSAGHAETAEALSRKIAELLVSYEAWAKDHALKLALSFPCPAKDASPDRREVVESLLDGLYEARKIAAQGPIYFDRRLTQLMEHDLPRLRAQFKDGESTTIQKLWEEMSAPSLAS